MTMYLEHFGLSEAPFKITPHTEFFFAGASRGETLEALIYAITSGEGMVKVTGEVGAGKTMLCRVLMERLPDNVETIYLAVPSLSPDEMLATIADDLGVELHGGNTTKLIRALQERLIAIHAEGKQVVALIDEAHAMPLETLEEIRLLSNLETSLHKLMQIVLFGQPELDQHLMLPNMRQLKERITHSFNLLPLPPRDIKDYLNFRLRAAGYKGPDLFSPEALKLIAEASEGLTRRINIYADKTLLAAYAENTFTITPDHVRAAISDTQIVLPAVPGQNRSAWAAAGTLLAGLAIGFVAGRLTAPDATVPVPHTTARSATEAQGKVVVAGGPAANADAISPSVEKIEAIKTETPAPANTVSKPEPMDTLPVTGVVSASSANKTIEVDWLEARMGADATRIRSLPTGRYAIQLMTADSRERSAIEAFLRLASRELNPDRIMVYPAGTLENPRVSVLYGNFADRTEATDELARLPVRLTKFRPYARSVGAVTDDIRTPVVDRR
jgi:type II secretory pathway predicted ATPase ExeA